MFFFDIFIAQLLFRIIVAALPVMGGAAFR
jgi:hypothetical protein